MYALIAFLLRPTISTKYPLAQKCLLPCLYFRFACRSNIIRLLFSFRYPIIWDTLYFSRMLISIWMCSFFTLTRRLFLVYFSHRHRLFFTPGRAGGCLLWPERGSGCRNSLRLFRQPERTACAVLLSFIRSPLSPFSGCGCPTAAEAAPERRRDTPMKWPYYAFRQRKTAMRME